MNIPNFLIPFDIKTERSLILDTFKQTYPQYTPLVGDDFGVLIECFLYRMNRYINYINFTISQNYLEYSSGEYLDKLVALAGIKRFEGTPFIAKLKITTTNPITLSKGTKFIDNKGNSAFLIQHANIESEGIVKIQLEDGLFQDYDINALEIPHIYIKSIQKLTPFIQDGKKESDEELKTRFLLSMTKPTTTGNLKSYQYYSSIPEIAKFKIRHKGLGVVEVIYEGKTEQSLQKLQESIQDKIPLTDEIIYTPVKTILIDLVITLKLKSSINPNSIINQADLNTRSFFENLQIGESISQAQIISVCFVDESIQDISMNILPPMNDESIYKLNTLSIEVAL